MKFTAILSLLTAVVLANNSVVVHRPNKEKSFIGPGPGCFGTVGPITEIDVPHKQIVVLYSGEGCKGSRIYTGPSAWFTGQVDVKSVEIFNQI